METFKADHARAEIAPGGSKVTSVHKIDASTDTSVPSTDTARDGQIHPLSALDPNGNCRINIFTEVPRDRTMRQYPYSRCYVVTSTAASGQVLQTSGFALSSTRVLTSNAHIINIEQRPGAITVARSYSITNPGGSINTTFDSHNAATVVSWGNDEKEANIGLRYCMLAMRDPLTITDGEGADVFTTITSVLSISPTPSLQLITRTVPNAVLMTGSARGSPRRITNGSVAEWFVTNLGGWLGRHTTSQHWDYMRGSPIFVNIETGPINGPLVNRAWLVGLVTDEVVASSPCTVNAGLFVDDGAVTRLLNAL